MAQMKEQIRAPTTELSDEEKANPSDAEFKTLVIRMLTELVEYSHEIEEKVKTMQSEMKKNIQGTKGMGRKPDSNQQFEVEGRKNHSIRTEWRNKNSKIEERLRNLWDNFKHSNIRIVRVAEENRKSKKLKTYLNK